MTWVDQNVSQSGKPVLFIRTVFVRSTIKSRDPAGAVNRSFAALTECVCLVLVIDNFAFRS